MTDDIYHYGVKGMKWGVRRTPDELGNTGKKRSNKTGNPNRKEIDKALDEFRKESDKLSDKQKAKNLAEAKIKFSQKFGDEKTEDGVTGSKKKPLLTPEEKKLIGIGAAFVAVGVAAYYLDKKSKADAKKLSGIGEISFDGKITPNAFMSQVNADTSVVWGSGNYFTKGSFDRPDITLPAGHTFRRFSRNPESSFNIKGTYTTISKADFGRYAFGFGELENGGSVGKYLVEFKSTKPVKIAAMDSQFKAMQKVLQDSGQPSNSKDVLKVLQKRHGGSWNPQYDSITKSFFSELKKQGFAGIIDEMDSGVIGESPSVLFDYSSFGSKSSSKITSDMMKEFGESLTNIPNRKLNELSPVFKLQQKILVKANS